MALAGNKGATIQYSHCTCSLSHIHVGSMGSYSNLVSHNMTEEVHTLEKLNTYLQRRK